MNRTLSGFISAPASRLMSMKKYRIALCVSFIFSYVMSFAQSATLSNMGFTFLFLYPFTRKGFYEKKKQPFLALFAALIVFVALYYGLIEAKNFIVFMLPFLTGAYIAHKMNFTPQFCYNYYLWYIIPTSLVNVATSHCEFSYIPNSLHVINICGGGTKHGTAGVGFILFIASLYNLHLSYICREKYKRKDIFFFFLSLYFTVFSSSRSYTMSLLGTLVLYWINRDSISKWKSWLIFIVCISSTYLLEMLTQYVAYFRQYPLLAQFMRADNFDNSAGVTSGRAWLWSYHMNLFCNSKLLMGDGGEHLKFGGGDYVPFLGMEAPAGSESPYTAQIACFGLLGIWMLLLLVRLFQNAINAHNLIGMCIIFCAIYNSVTGGNETSIWGAASLVYFLYYTSFETFTNKRLLSRLPHRATKWY